MPEIHSAPAAPDRLAANAAPMPARADKPQPLASGRLLCGGLLAVSFTVAMTAIGGELKGEFPHLAVRASAVAMILLSSYLILVTSDPSRHSVSRVMRLLPVAGVLFAVLSLALLLESHTPGAGWILGIGGVLVLWIHVQAEDRARKERARRARMN